MHPVWGPFSILAAGLLLLILFAWALLHLAPLVLGIIAAVLGIRWLIRNTSAPRSDAAVAILRERYARGEITKEEFDAKLREPGRATMNEPTLDTLAQRPDRIERAR